MLYKLKYQRVINYSVNTNYLIFSYLLFPNNLLLTQKLFCSDGLLLAR